MKKILVSGVSGILGFGILRSLREAKHVLHYLVGVSFFDSLIAQENGFFEKAPLTKDENYIDWLLSIIEKYKIDLLFPGIDVDMYKWQENRSVIEKTGAKVVCNSSSLVSLCKDKWEFNRFMKTMDLDDYMIPSSICSDYYFLKFLFGTPFIMKPRNGFGSKGVMIIYEHQDFHRHIEEFGSNWIAQKLVGSVDEEYTSSVFGDGKGSYTASISFRRKLINGYTGEAEVIFSDKIEIALGELCSIFKPEGPTNFQFREQDGQLKLIEINPRISSSTSLKTAFGYNECEMAVNYYLDGELPLQPVIRKGKAIRYVEDFILYEEIDHV
jgi:carbamoyl-phosphate synthase large subunit